MALNLPTASDALKVFYLPQMQNTLNYATILMSRIERDSSMISADGKTYTMSINYDGNISAGIGRAEAADLPTAGNQAYKSAVIPNKYVYGQVYISGQVVNATKTNAGSFIQAIRSEIDGCVRDTKKRVNQQMNSDGTYALAHYVSGAGSGTIVVDDGLGNILNYLPNTQFTCDTIDISDYSSKLDNSVLVTKGADVATGTNLAISTSTFSGSLADGDLVVFEDSLGYQMNGLDVLVDNADPHLLSGGLYGLPVATYPWWTSQVVGDDTSMTDLRRANMQRVISKIVTNSGLEQREIDLILGHPFTVDKYVEMMANDRISVNTMMLDGGFDAVAFNGIPIVSDPDCKANRLYFLPTSKFRIVRSADYEWIDDGAVLRKVASKDAYEGTLFVYQDLAILQRNCCGVLKGISI